jgi:hypothetical protein
MQLVVTGDVVPCAVYDSELDAGDDEREEMEGEDQEQAGRREGGSPRSST